MHVVAGTIEVPQLPLFEKIVVIPMGRTVQDTQTSESVNTVLVRQVVTDSFKLETAVSRFGVLNEESAELHVDLCSSSSEDVDFITETLRSVILFA